VLSYGLPIQNIDVCNAGFSDHKPILFTTTLDCPSINHQTSTKLFWKISADTGMVFSAAFEVASKSCNLEGRLEELSAEEHLTLFNSTCINILDDIAPLKQKTVKPKSEPWLNDNIRTLRQTCRRAERRWKKDKLQVSYEILRDSLCTFQKAVKAARTNCFSEVISKNCHRPKILFHTINSVVNPSSDVLPKPSLTICNNFLHFFVDKIANIRSHIQPSLLDPSNPVTCSSVFV